MVKLCEWKNYGIRHYRALSTDFTTGWDISKYPLNNGDEVYCMDNQSVWLADEENRKLINQSDGSEIVWM